MSEQSHNGLLGTLCCAENQPLVTSLLNGTLLAIAVMNFQQTLFCTVTGTRTLPLVKSTYSAAAAA